MSTPLLHLRLTRPLAFIDCETTGLAPQRDRIVELAVLCCTPDGEQRSSCRRLHPGIPIPPAATAVHGITDEHVADCPSFAHIAASLARLLQPCDLAGFNLTRFDLPLLQAEFRRAGIDFPLANRDLIDVLEIYHQRHPRNLASAVRYYLGHEHGDAHDALADSAATAAVLDALLGSHADLPRTVPELHARFAGVDLAGRLREQDGQLVLTFGKHAGRTLSELAHEQPDYLRWLLTQDFLPDFCAQLQRALTPSESRR